MGLDRFSKTPCGFCFVEYYTHQDALDCMKYVGGTKLDERIIRSDLDPGFLEGRQYGYVFRREEDKGCALADWWEIGAVNQVDRFVMNTEMNLIRGAVATGVLMQTKDAEKRRSTGKAGERQDSFAGERRKSKLCDESILYSLLCGIFYFLFYQIPVEKLHAETDTKSC